MDGVNFNEEKPAMKIEEKVGQITRRLSIHLDQKINIMKENGAIASTNLKEKTQILKE